MDNKEATELAEAINKYLVSLKTSPTDDIDEIRGRPEVKAHIARLEEKYLKGE